MLEIVLTSSESDQYSSAPKDLSKFPLMYMTGYFCRSVYFLYSKFAFRIFRMLTLSSHFQKIEDVHFYNIRRSGLYFVGLSDSDVPPYLVVEVLSR